MRDTYIKNIRKTSAKDTNPNLEVIEVDGVEIPAKAVSERKKAHYEALKKEIEYKQMKGKFIDLDEFKSGLIGEARTLGEKFEVLPDRLAPKIIGVTSVNEISTIIKKDMNEVLAGLFERFTK